MSSLDGQCSSTARNAEWYSECCSVQQHLAITTHSGKLWPILLRVTCSTDEQTKGGGGGGGRRER